MNMQDTTMHQRIMGQVKWFDPSRGLGFIVADQGGPDILLHANVLRNFGQGSVVDGSTIEFEMQITPRGLQAAKVIAITPPADTAAPLVEVLQLPENYEVLHPTLPARAKWYDKTKGFGFANLFGSNQDVFIHADVLRSSGLTELQTGEAIGLRLMDGERGPVAIEIVDWEIASR